MSHFSSVIIGNESLAIQCGALLLEEGHTIRALVTRNRDVINWAQDQDITVLEPGRDLAQRLTTNLAGRPFDWLLSIANLDIIPKSVLALPRRGAVNFHDGPLPHYAGLNAPVWAALEGEKEHGISWHMIEGGVDEGDIIAQSTFAINETDTALTLNTKCYAAGIESFPEVMRQLASPEPARQKQDLSKRRYCARDDRPEGGARLDFGKAAGDLARLVRILDHGDYWNPLGVAKFEAGGRLWLAQGAEISNSPSGAAPGAVVAADRDQLTIATRSGDIILTKFADCEGREVCAQDITRVGAILPSPGPDELSALTQALSPLAAHEPSWRQKLEAITPLELPLIEQSKGAPQPITRVINGVGEMSMARVGAAFGILALRLAQASSVDFAAPAPLLPGKAASYGCPWMPIKLSASGSVSSLTKALGEALLESADKVPFSADLIARLPGADGPALPLLGICDNPEAGLIGPSALTLAVEPDRITLLGDRSRVSAQVLDLYGDRLAHLLAHLDQSEDITALSILPERERHTLLVEWNDTKKEYNPNTCIHTLIEAQVDRTPHACALAFEGESLSYKELDEAANQMAHHLVSLGVRPGVIVGLHVPRSAQLVIASLAIMKAGGAYLPMDPAYPAERTALYAQDSQAAVIITTQELAAELEVGSACLLILGKETGSFALTRVESGVRGEDLAYMIYTSGSTGRPKGVMVEHRNVANFFVGMDDRIPHKEGSVWLAVTSLSFDISVLELFWTLSRGFKLVLSGDESRALVSGDTPSGAGLGGMEFSLYYWGNDDGVGRDKYRSLLEGAKFADENGFCAVWTPERHFHAFGGPYPNPSVTGAAVAGLTKNIGVRAGSCVAPLHHTARIAEEWAVIDNLTNGRAGLAIASGWQPDDFILRPENTPPENKPAMFRQIADLRKLWAGQSVEFARKDGKMHGVVTQPRPLSKTLDLWVTTAGNPETWKEAGRNGCHVLTHLLGQSVDEVGEKISLYHEALREAGHDPARFKITLMLHSFLADTRDGAREIAREPMKDYLRSAAGLIKQYAWAFPAFKKPKGVDNAFQLDLGSLTEDELEGILDFAFERYFNDSGLFGTIEDALARVHQVKDIGVTEIACLIDYGIPVDRILEGLKPLAEVVKIANEGVGPAQDDYSIAAQIVRHGVTHLQSTPSMARMLAMNEEASDALLHVKQLMVGGEALPGALVAELNGLTKAPIENMYGPTETTIWSTTQTASGAGEGVVSIGTPIANTQVYVLDEVQEPVPLGVAGELYIGGDGVTRGYWQREELTRERFIPDPFSAVEGARLYRTGDLARWRLDGTLEFLGRADFQIKLRGYRIELGEIESAIDQLDGVRQSVVIAREDQPGAQQLVAYIRAENPLDEAALKTALGEHLPAHMIPARFVALEAFPLTPNKKVDRNALPAPGKPAIAAAKPILKTAEKPVSDGANGAAVSLEDITTGIATIWSETLGIPEFSARDNFFNLGGHSLLAVQAHREIRSRLGVSKLSITDIFRYPVLGDLAQAVAQKAGVSGSLTNGAASADMSQSAPGSSDQAENQAKDQARASETSAQQKALARADAMARRRALRANRSRT